MAGIESIVAERKKDGAGRNRCNGSRCSMLWHIDPLRLRSPLGSPAVLFQTLNSLRRHPSRGYRIDFPMFTDENTACAVSADMVLDRYFVGRLETQI